MLQTFSDAPTQTSTVNPAVFGPMPSPRARAVIAPRRRPFDGQVFEPWRIAKATPAKSNRTEALPLLVVPITKLEKLEALRLTLAGLAGHAKTQSTIADLVGASFEAERGVVVSLRRTAGSNVPFSERARLTVAEKKGLEAAAYRLMLRRADGQLVEIRIALSIGSKTLPGAPVAVLQLMATAPTRTSADFVVLDQLRQSLTHLWG